MTSNHQHVPQSHETTNTFSNCVILKRQSVYVDKQIFLIGSINVETHFKRAKYYISKGYKVDRYVMVILISELTYGFKIATKT